MGTAVFSLAARARQEWCMFLTVIILDYFNFVVLRPHAWQRPASSIHLRSCNRVQLSTKFRGFQNHVARKKLSQFIPWLWSNLFLNQARTSYPYIVFWKIKFPEALLYASFTWCVKCNHKKCLLPGHYWGSHSRLHSWEDVVCFWRYASSLSSHKLRTAP